MTLYSENVSNFSSKCRIVISEKGLKNIEIVSPPKDFLNSSGFRKISPLGHVPALQIDAATSIFESEVIDEYLEERFPERPLMPSDPLARARVRIVCRFHDLYLEPPLRQLGRMQSSGLIADAKSAELALRLDQLESLITGPWAIGSQFTLADCSLAPTILYMTVLLPLLDMPTLFEGRTKLARWWELINQRPTTRKVLDEERQALLDILSR